MTKLLIIFHCVLAILFVSLIKTSDQWIPLIYRLPSRAVELGKQRYPSNLRFSFNVKEYNTNLFIETNEDGALVHSNQIPAQSIVLGSRSSNLFFPPDERWTSLVKLPNYNFGFPGFSYSDVAPWIEVFLSSVSNPPREILLCDVNFFHSVEPKANFKQFLDLSQFRLWDKPVDSHPLYEWIFFNWLRKPDRAQVLAANPPTELLQNPPVHETTATETQRFRDYLTILKKVHQNLKSRSIRFSLILTPVSPQFPIKQRANQFLRKNLPALNIPFLDIENCFQKNERAKFFFLARGYLSKEGQKCMASCFDQLYFEKVY